MCIDIYMHIHINMKIDVYIFFYIFKFIFIFITIFIFMFISIFIIFVFVCWRCAYQRPCRCLLLGKVGDDRAPCFRSCTLFVLLIFLYVSRAGRSFFSRWCKKGINATLTLGCGCSLCRVFFWPKKGVNATLTLAWAVVLVEVCLAERGSTRRSIRHGHLFCMKLWRLENPPKQKQRETNQLYKHRKNEDIT